MVSMKIKESGFSLIEALIAFLVLSVGILGALIFHANVLRDSSDNKAKLEAMALAESWMENHRNQRFSDVSAFETYLSNLALTPATSVSLQLETYGVQVNSVSSVATQSNVFNITYSIFWPFTDPSSSVEFSSYLGWLDPSKLVDPNETGSSDSEEYSGDIPIPSGTLSELPRLEVVDLNDPDITVDDSRSNATITIYNDAGVDKVAVQIDDTTTVQLAALSNSNNEIFTITGRIYLNRSDPDYYVERGFGKVFGVTDPSELNEAGASSFVEGVDYYRIVNDGEARFFKNNVIDVRASAGANCVVSRYLNASSVTTKVKGVDYTLSSGIFGDYICVAGTGWNGTIKPYFRHYDGSKLEDIVIGDQNCVPSTRSFRYYIIETGDLNALEQYKDFNNWPSTGIEGILASVASTSIVGQSGLVRFFGADDQVGSSTEGLLWDQYFWHNPNYLINPNTVSGGVFQYTPSVAAPSLFNGANIAAYEGYKSPVVTNVTGKDSEISYPGDISHQNFFISNSGNGTGSLDSCADVIDDMVSSGNLGNAPYTNLGSGFTSHSHLASYGVPSYEFEEAGSIRGYIPQSDVTSFSVGDFNKSIVSGEPETSGVVVLGYTLATDSVGGVVTIPSGASYSSDVSIAGNPEPVISITCTVDPDSLDTSVVSGAWTYEYSCGVPITWKGEVFAHPTSGSGLSSCLPLNHLQTVSSPYPSGSAGGDYEDYFGNATVTSTSISSNEVDDPAILYFFNNFASAGLGTVSSSVFNPLQFYDVTVSADIESNSNDFCFQ